MTAECTRRSKFSKLVPYHILGDINGNKLVTIVNCDSMTYEVR